MATSLQFADFSPFILLPKKVVPKSCPVDNATFPARKIYLVRQSVFALITNVCQTSTL